jgi:hypothetical protein
MRRRLVGLVAAVLVAAGVGLVAPATAQAAPYCGITWGSLAKTGHGPTHGVVTGVRAGEQTCYDRLVVDLGRGATGYTVRYVSGVPYQARGGTIPLRGGAFLEIVVSSPAYDPATGRATYSPANPRELANVTGYRTFRQVAYGGTFEGMTTVGLGVRARLPFRAFLLAGPGSGYRLVVDVAHLW